MDELNQDGSEVLETTETDTGAVETTEEETLTAEQIADLKARAAKADDLEAKNKQLYARVKKEEAKPADTPTPTLSIKDQVFLAKADIHEDDLDEVLDRAKSKGISIAEAYNQVKPLLNARSEERKTASATHTRGGARGASKPTGQDLLAKAEQSGEIPETEDGMTALAEARMARKKNK